jgi:hypothetical protein
MSQFIALSVPESESASVSGSLSVSVSTSKSEAELVVEGRAAPKSWESSETSISQSVPVRVPTSEYHQSTDSQHHNCYQQFQQSNRNSVATNQYQQYQEQATMKKSNVGPLASRQTKSVTDMFRSSSDMIKVRASPFHYFTPSNFESSHRPVLTPSKVTPTAVTLRRSLRR